MEPALSPPLSTDQAELRLPPTLAVKLPPAPFAALRSKVAGFTLAPTTPGSPPIFRTILPACPPAEPVYTVAPPAVMIPARPFVDCSRMDCPILTERSPEVPACPEVLITQPTQNSSFASP